mgnify:CR=1 FL=1
MTIKTVDINGRVFIKTLIKFNEPLEKNTFSNYTSKTLGEAVKQNVYKHLKDVVTDLNRDIPLGKYLSDTKELGDKTYLNFLNSNGDKIFCKFKIQDKRIFNKKGLYVYFVKNEIKYIGRCHGNSNYEKRINDGYGNISPRNCYKDGQTTNCHINRLINEYRNDIELYVYPMESSDEEINRSETVLIAENQPEWNRKK